MRFIVSVYLLAGLGWIAGPAALEADAQDTRSPQTPAERPATLPAPAAGPSTPPTAKSDAPASVDGSVAEVPPAAVDSPADAVVPAAVSGDDPRPDTATKPAGAAALARQKGPPVAPSQDAERPIIPVPERPSETGFSARLSFGLGGALWFTGGDTKLSRPLWLGLDLGYALSRSVSIVARATSWLPSDNLASEFVGAGAVYRFVAERIYVASALGVALTRVGPASDWSHYVQGLALQADVGQWFTLTTQTAFSVGAHFQIGSPLLGKKPDAFTSLQAGIFVAFGLR